MVALQCFYFRSVEAKHFFQYLAGMLTEQRRVACGTSRGAAHVLKGVGHKRHFAEFGVRYLPNQSAGFGLGISKSLAEIINRGCRHPGDLETFEPLGTRSGAENFRELWSEFFKVC